MTGDEPIELRLLGRFVVLRDGREVPAAEFGGRKVRALLRGLAIRRGSFIPNDVLTDMLWGARAPADPAANLQVLVNRARRALGRPALVLTGPGGYALAGGDALTVDAEQFLTGLQRARRLDGRAALDAYAHALAGWRGEPLAEDSYADWAAEYRDRLLRARQAALEEAAQMALAAGDVARAVEFAAAAALEQPLREVAVLTLIRALAAAGDPAAALGRYDDYRRALADQLGVDPSAEAQALHAQLQTGALPARRRTMPAHEFARLPFVGRAAELAAVAAVLEAPEVVVVRGASGAGKSRLVDALAQRAPVVLVRAFPAERDEPWSLARSLVREILAGDAAAAATLPEPIQAALGWLLPEVEQGDGGAPPDPESRRALLVEAMIRMLRDAAMPVVVDDLQWADATSLALLEAVLARLSGVGAGAGAGVGAVLALRPAEAAEREAVTALLTRLGTRARMVQLGSLDPAAIAQLVDAAELARALETATDRTPLAIAEVLRALAA
ncbi:MAG TPA: BTAD domain-containing putative transcriptional regulator, partial [Jatrophihabitans sp.]|nr:BTAD domain-containing putative transcriptional regulator [Jatrophihabitans sp.]